MIWNNTSFYWRRPWSPDLRQYLLLLAEALVTWSDTITPLIGWDLGHMIWDNTSSYWLRPWSHDLTRYILVMYYVSHSAWQCSQVVLLQKLHRRWKDLFLYTLSDYYLYIIHLLQFPLYIFVIVRHITDNLLYFIIPKKGRMTGNWISESFLCVCNVIQCSAIIMQLIFSQNPHKRHPIARLLGETWCVFCGFKLLVYILPQSLDDVCSILLNWTVLWWHLTV